MIFRLTTGYFVWNLHAWLMVFVLSAIILSLFITRTAKKRGGRCVDIGERIDRTLPIDPFWDAALHFLNECISPWKKWGPGHLISVLVLTFLFVVAVFSK